MTKDIYHVPLLCTGNSARSVIAQAIMKRVEMVKFTAYSAGPNPGSAPHPDTLDRIRGLHHDTGATRSKRWSGFASSDAPQMDFVFTVCDSAAAKKCPVWPVQPMTAHRGAPDRARATGPEAIKWRA